MSLHHSFRRSSGFAGLMVAMLALGVGATTALFSVVNGVLLRPLPFPNANQLVLLGERMPSVPVPSNFAFIDNPAAFLTWQRQAADFTALAAFQPDIFDLAGAGTPRLLYGIQTTPNFYDILDAHAQLGRLLRPGDENDTSHPIVISNALWRSAFNADPNVIGRSVGAPGATAVVVGVMPPGFELTGRELGPMMPAAPAEYFEALKFRNGERINAVYSDFNYSVLGRLRPGVTAAQALAQLNVIQANLARSSGEKIALYGDIISVRDYTVAASRQELWLLLGGVGAVLLIVCVNLGGLWLTRLADRRRDWAIRAALGAAPGRLARQLLLESVALAVVGGGLGVALAAVSLRSLLALAPANLPRLDEVHLDWRVFAFGLALSLAAGVLTGIVPALRLSRLDPQASLKASGSSATADRASLGSRQTLIAVQAALATLLLATVGLLGLSFYRLVTLPTGFSARQSITANVTLIAGSDNQRGQILGRLPAAIAAVPGVRAVAFTSHLPLLGEIWIDSAALPGHVYPPGQTPSINVRFTSPEYFTAIGIPLLAGRDFRESDRALKPLPAVISLATAHMLWPGKSVVRVLGQQFLFDGSTPEMVVGIAADARDGKLTTAPPSVVYQPYWLQPPFQVSLVVRTSLPAAALATPLRRAIWSVAPAAPVTLLRPLDALKSSAVAPQRYQLILLLVFAFVALVLAAMGVYALVAHSVARRAKELAIRITMGARGADLWSLVLRQALAPVIAGVSGGLVAALVFGRLLATLLYEVRPSNPGVLVGVGVAVLAAALAACVLPAHRATRTDALLALRAE